MINTPQLPFFTGIFRPERNAKPVSPFAPERAITYSNFYDGLPASDGDDEDDDNDDDLRGDWLRARRANERTISRICAKIDTPVSSALLSRVENLPRPTSVWEVPSVAIAPPYPLVATL